MPTSECDRASTWFSYRSRRGKAQYRNQLVRKFLKVEDSGFCAVTVQRPKPESCGDEEDA